MVDEGTIDNLIEDILQHITENKENFNLVQVSLGDIFI